MALFVSNGGEKSVLFYGFRYWRSSSWICISETIQDKPCILLWMTVLH